MADKFEREIEEILAKLDDGAPAAPGGNSPISISQKRKQKAKAQRVRTSRTNPFSSITPTTLLFTGAGLVFGGLIISGAWSPAIWIAFAGVVLFIGAFAWSFRKTNGGGGSAAPRSGGTYWRDRYIDDTPHDGGIKGRFRRK
ncbi:MAG: hypothetical protein AB7N24_10950 [Dehalococcoidia bacterium]